MRRSLLCKGERRLEAMVKELDALTDEDRRALRGSKFAPLPSLSARPSSSSQPRLAHPGGPVTTNKAVALAKFLERKLQDPNGLASLNPDLLELAVKNAKDTVNASGTSKSGRTVRHVTSFGECENLPKEKEVENSELKKHKKKLKKKEKKSNKKHKVTAEDPGNATRKPKKKLKL